MGKKKKYVLGTAAALAGTYAVLDAIAKRQRAQSTYEGQPEEKNPLEGKKVVFVEDDNDPENADGVRGHLEAVGTEEVKRSTYDRVVKRGIDKFLAFGGLVMLSPVFLVTSIAIKVEDPGPVFFTQKRVGENKKYFKLHKFRSMKMDTPHDVPTHMLANPDQYITRVGKFIRAHSIDELPQIWDIFVGNMSVIGPRPALWNQDKLTALRDQYDANNIKPGLTGWAQINGRDELELEDKARLDGEYVRNESLAMDAKCFLESLHVFGKDDSIVEGGTGEIAKEKGFAENADNIDYSDKKFSVLMSVYNKENPEFFDQALNSILVKQSLVPNELVLICDGPLTSELDNIIENYQQRFPDIVKVTRLEKNGGLGNALKVGLPLCSYDLVARADSDDICCPNRFEKQIAYMIAHPEVGILSSYIDEFDSDPSNPIDTKKLPVTHKELVKLARFRNPINHMAVMYRKHLILGIGGYRQIQYVEDYDLWIRAIANGIELANIPEVLIHARIGAGMIDRRGSKAYIQSWKSLCDYMLHHKMINHFEYVRNMAAIMGFVSIPGGVRKRIYKLLLRTN